MTMRTASLFLAVALASGCAGRKLISVEDGPGGVGRTTVLATIETKSVPIIGFNSAKLVYWECGESGGGLVCRQTCDVKDDEGDKLMCQKLTAF